MHCRSHSKMSLMINKNKFQIHTLFCFDNNSNKKWLFSKLSLNLLVLSKSHYATLIKVSEMFPHYLSPSVKSVFFM